MVVLIDRIKREPSQPELTDRETVAKKYSHWRWRVFYSMYIGYALYYLTRNSFTFAMPAMMNDLGFDKGQLGLLASILSLVYGVSKFAAGILADRSNPKYFMALGLMATGVFNILFGFSSSLVFLAIFWGLNGWFQGFGWPACAKLLTHWYSQSERGRWWSWWNTSHNLGGALIPLFVAFCAANFGWRVAMIAPGVLVIIGGLFLMNRLTDTPKALGLPPVEKFRNDYRSPPANTQGEELSAKQILFSYVLNNPYIWVLGITYFFVYLVRMAMNTWTVLYLVETKGYSQMGAGAVIFWFEIGGMFGSLVAGWASDKIFSANRGPVNALFCLFTTLAIYTFWITPGNQPLLDSLLIFTIGFFVFGPQMLIGVAAAELSHKRAAASATGFTGFIAYIGSAVAGYPLGILMKSFGWDGFFVALTGCAIVSFLLLFPLWGVKTAPENSLSKQRVR
jgi:OPA family sugar phosphate sensor protein UhpC-like MFS transporter